MTAREFLELVAKPDLEDLKTNYSDLRVAWHAVASIDALASHIFWQLREAGHSHVTSIEDDTAYREVLAQGDSDFALLRDLAKANKHVTLTRGSPRISRSGNVEKRSLDWGEFRWGEGRWGSPAQVVVRTDGGEDRVVETLAFHCLCYLEELMSDCGI